jgi:hypothetical protein
VKRDKRLCVEVGRRVAQTNRCRNKEKFVFIQRCRIKRYSSKKF